MRIADSAPLRQVIHQPAQLGEILRGRRKARRISQQDLATKLGVAQSRVSNLESDPAGVTLDRLLLVAKLLGLELVLQEKAPASASKVEW